jgi:hypothetical protein
MISALISLALGLAPLRADSATTAQVPSTPPLQCNITMSLWCIVGFDGTINVADDGHTRIWYLKEAIGMDAGPLEIIEPKGYCDDHADTFRSSVGESSQGTDAHGTYSSAKFNLNQDGCTLEFRWPKGVDSEPEYRRTMMWDIMARTNASAMQQLGFILQAQGAEKH